MYGYYLIGSDLLVKKMAAVGTKTSKVRQSETLFITLSACVRRLQRASFVEYSINPNKFSHTFSNIIFVMGFMSTLS